MKPCALIIAKDSSVRISLARLFEDENFTVLSARDEEEGAYLFASAEIDVVIFDLPGDLDICYSALLAIKEINPLTPLILLADKSALPENADDLQGDALLPKPVDIAALLALVNEFTSKSA